MAKIVTIDRGNARSKERPLLDLIQYLVETYKRETCKIRMNPVRVEHNEAGATYSLEIAGCDSTLYFKRALLDLNKKYKDVLDYRELKKVDIKLQGGTILITAATATAIETVVRMGFDNLIKKQNRKKRLRRE